LKMGLCRCLKYRTGCSRYITKGNKILICVWCMTGWLKLWWYIIRGLGGWLKVGLYWRGSIRQKCSCCSTTSRRTIKC
jgi:hypothetical protein